MPFFSIIAPVFNKEQDLPNCLESIISQDLKDWEMLLVIDGSTDASADVAKIFASKDKRFTVIEKSQNEGTHLARMTGVKEATGRYMLFIDPDDKLAPGILSSVKSELLKDESVDIFHYGMRLFGVNDVDPRICEEVEEYGNREFPDLFEEEICDAAFLGIAGRQQDWRVVQRVFESRLCKRAFEQMTNDRLGRGQDSYEYFVLSTIANHQVTNNALVGYEYYYGAGVTNFEKISKEKYLGIARQFQSCIDAVYRWSSEFTGFDTALHCESYRKEMFDLLINDWDIRLSEHDKLDAARETANVIGSGEMATQLFRIVRDRAYEIWVNKASEDNLAALWEYCSLAAELAEEGDYKKDDLFFEYRDSALGHLSDIKARIEDSCHSDSKKGFFERIKMRLFSY